MVKEKELVENIDRAEVMAYREKPLRELLDRIDDSDTRAGMPNAVSTLTDLVNAASAAVSETEPYDTQDGSSPRVSLRNHEHQQHIVVAANAYVQLSEQIARENAPDMHTLFQVDTSTNSPVPSNQLREVVTLFGGGTLDNQMQEGAPIQLTPSNIPGYRLRIVPTESATFVQAVKSRRITHAGK